MRDPNIPITVIILSRNRPTYLWACLDTLYRYTNQAARFILLDNASDDPGVRQVVTGFERRGMFEDVVWFEDNSPARIGEAVGEYAALCGDYLVVIESDVTVFETQPCWLTRLCNQLDSDPNLGLLGSLVDHRDFVSLEDARVLLPDADEVLLNTTIKGESAERNLPTTTPIEMVIDPFNPPGRLLIVRKSVLPKLPFGSDGVVYRAAKAAGIGVGISTLVRHRHLSLLNIYDYPDYDFDARKAYMQELLTPVPIVLKPSKD